MNDISLLSFAPLDPRLCLDCRLLSLRQFELQVRIGVHAFEKLAPQRMLFDVDLCVPLSRAHAAQDDIADTVNYDFVRTLIMDLVTLQHYELQETLCDAILGQVMECPDVQAARVATRKPDVYPDCASVGTERMAAKPWH